MRAAELDPAGAGLEHRGHVLRDRGWLDAIGHPHSDALHVTERFHRPDFGHIEVQITINDPKAYKEPFTVRQDWAFLPDTDLLEYHCADNERDVRHFVFK